MSVKTHYQLGEAWVTACGLDVTDDLEIQEDFDPSCKRCCAVLQHGQRLADGLNRGRGEFNDIILAGEVLIYRQAVKVGDFPRWAAEVKEHYGAFGLTGQPI